MGQFNRLKQLLKSSAQPCTTVADLSSFLDCVGDRSIVMLGEASHGTHEFYSERAELTKLLVEKKGFNVVAIEGDWPDAYKVNQYIKSKVQDTSAADALKGFSRFPTWMWDNTVVYEFVEWLRDHNARSTKSSDLVSFYGLDIYSLYRSIDETVKYLEKVDPEGAVRAKSRFDCFSRFGEDCQYYGMVTSLGFAKDCENEVVEQLVDITKNEILYTKNSDDASEEFFSTEQNTRLIQAAERYYRTMFDKTQSCWNLRDTHMADTVDRIRKNLLEKNIVPKIVIWAHNSHVGDARFTERAEKDEINIGQLLKQRYGDHVVSIGFLTYDGTVTAASNWDGITERKSVVPALQGSYERLFHMLEIPRFFLDFRNDKSVKEALYGPMLERAIGVIYRPETERQSHYFLAELSRQFDSIVFIDRTHAVKPLTLTRCWELGEEPPETFPTGY